MPGVIIVLKYPDPLFLFNLESETVLKHSVSRNCWQKNMQNDKNHATLKKVQRNFSPGWGEINGKIISTWNLGIY
jgi:hypothetical protein